MRLTGLAGVLLALAAATGIAQTAVVLPAEVQLPLAQAIVMRYNPAHAPEGVNHAEIENYILRAMAAWNLACGHQKLAYGGRTDDDASAHGDGISTIGWEPQGENGGTTWRMSDPRGVVEVDIVLNATGMHRWGDFRNIMLHEMGHAIGLPHSDDPDSLMARAPDYSQTLRITPKEGATCQEMYWGQALNSKPAFCMGLGCR